MYVPPFNYTIIYEITSRKVEIQKEGGKYKFMVDDKSYSQAKFLRDVSLLPKNVIACYSGDNLRLWNDCYWPYYNDYISTIKNAESIPELPMLYINRYNLAISMLLLFFYDFKVFTDVKDFCNNTLKIQAISKIKFTFNIKKIREWKENLVIQMVKAICNIENMSELSKDTIELTTIQLRKRLEYMEQREFFKMMYAATMPKEDKVITDISFDILLNNGATISLEDLSEGEQKNLLMFVILESIADENSLLLLDEPDSHIHISRKTQLKELFEKYSNRENVITTHSPTLAVKFEGHIEGLGLDSNGNTVIIDSEKAKLVASITDNMWNIHEQNMFLASNKPITLLVEGQTDKIHILAAYKALQANYIDLDFDVFYFGGADNIPQFMIGLKTCETDFSNRKIIAIFDNDKEGRNCLNQTQVKYIKQKKNKYGLYAITLPSDIDSTIENLYDASKYDEAFKNIVGKKSFKGLVSTYAESITKEAKIEMSNMVGTFNSSDFDGFKPLFDLLQEIKSL